jgi:prefoldin subunit 5
MTKTKKYARQASFALLCIFFLVYAIYHIGNAFREKTELFTVTEETLEYTSDLSGYIFRDERVLYGAGDACSYNYANGEKVAKNSVVAKSYYADGSKLAKSIKELAGRIEILEKSCSVLHIDLEQTDKEISRLRAEIAEKTASGNVAYVNSAQKELLILLHKRSLAEQNKNSYASEISILKAELTSLKASAASLGADVITPSSGYFYSYTDGLESVFSASAAESISFESFDAAVSAKPSKSSAAIRKVASIGKWYFVC